MTKSQGSPEDGAPKSAYELAMERLRKKDADAGIERQPVTEEQKSVIAEIRNFYQAKIAELEVLHQDRATWAGRQSILIIADGYARGSG